MNTPTDIQRQYLQLLSAGLNQKQIAYQLNKSTGTIKLGFRQLRTRLHAKNLYQVIALAVAYRWIEMPPLKE